MWVAEDGAAPLPWLAGPLAAALRQQRGHALLVHAAAGVGPLPFSLVLAQSWLCEQVSDVGAADGQGARLACGRCGSCRLVQAKVHPDLMLLMPEAQRRELDWPLPGDKTDSDKKPSRQIRVEEVRLLIDWVFKTSARGRGKVAVLTPGESLNTTSANALLKTLEEPPPGTRIIITTPDPMRLLPTVRSRCQRLRLAEPDETVATNWLEARGVAEPKVLLAAAAGRPLDALALHEAGVKAEHWRRLPQALARGQAAAVQGWAVPRLLELLQKLCHDAMAVAGGAAPRYFEPGTVPAAGSMARLRAWSLELQRVARHAAHPWNEGVLADALVAAAARALRGPAQASQAPVRSASTTRPTGSAADAGFDTLPG
jgi:DNA polymerase-3 subunit delta'